MAMTLGGYMFRSYSHEIADGFRVIFADPMTRMTSATWAVHLGGALMNKMDGASSMHQGARLFWALGNFVGDDLVFAIQNRVMTQVPAALSAYWNYKNAFTSEEFAFTHNLARIREVRKKYDPHGIFALPAGKNQGSKEIDVCFAAYHCSGNGEIVSGSDGSDCQCQCEQEWTGEMCEERKTPGESSRRDHKKYNQLGSDTLSATHTFLRATA